MVTRHSKQMPIPQTGPRHSPVTERLKPAVSDCRMAAATVVPGSTSTGDSSIEIHTSSAMDCDVALNGIRLRRNGGRAAHQLIDQQPRRRQRGCDAQSFMSGRREDVTITGA